MANNKLDTRTTLGCVYVFGSVKKASFLLKQVLGNALSYDSADRLFVELRSLGFSPSVLRVTEESTSACIVDPNIGKVHICCHHIRGSVH